MGEKVSVIVPIYNVEPYLKRCVDSLLAQTYSNCEILLVDDCSTDNCAGIAKEYAQAHPELCRFIQREKNGGLSAARNTGIDAAAGDWLAFVDSDDWVTEDYISVMYEVAKHDQPDIVVNNSCFFYYNEKSVRVVCFAPEINTSSSIEDKLVDLRFSAVCKLFRKGCFTQHSIRFPEDIRKCEDISTLIPLYTRVNKISVLHQPSYYYYQRSNSLSNAHKDMDFGFYPKTIQRMYDLSADGFEKQLEYIAISQLMYGMVMNMLRGGKEKSEICGHVDWFEAKYPTWRKNPYLSRLPKAKQIFISCAGRKQYAALKAMIWLWDKKQKITRKCITD